MKAVIMAGGVGSRLRPLTCDIPKPMVPIVNIPVIEHIINLLKRNGITDIAVTTYYLPNIIEEYLGCGKRWGVRLKYFIEGEPLGTAGSVRNASQFLDEPFIVISGDAITDYDLLRSISFHQERQAEATLILAKEEIPLNYGVVMTDKEGRIIRFLEKPNWSQVFSDTVNTGIYILQPDVFQYYQRGQKFDFSKDLFPLMLKNKRNLYGLVMEGYWNDIGSLDEYLKTQFDFLNSKIKLPFSQNCSHLGNNIWLEEEVDIDDSAKLIGPLYLSKGSVVGKGAYLEKSIIGRNCRINPYASIKKSVLWDNNLIGSQAELRGTVLANNVTLQERVKIYDHTALGKKVYVGKGSKIVPGVKIWPEKQIAEEVEIDKSIVWETGIRKNLFTAEGIIGQSNIDITPEFVAKLATAFGALLEKEDEVVVSSDSYEFSIALKRILLGSLQAAGVQVTDIGDSISSITRSSVVSLKAKIGVYITLSQQDAQKSIIKFFNEDGGNISNSKQKEIEKKFFAEDYSRVMNNEVGKYAYAPEMLNDYFQKIFQIINYNEIKKNCYNIVVDYEYASLGNILPLFLKKLNCHLISTRNYSFNNYPLSLQKRLESKEKVARIIRDIYADLGLIIDHGGEELYLVSLEGDVFSKTQYQVLISYLLLERGLKELILPLNAPSVIETMAREYKSEIKYTPVNWQIQTKFFNIYPYDDALFGLALILEKMAVDNLTIDQLLSRVPEFYLNNAEIPCAWEKKGKIMHHLSKEADENTEMIDGLKFRHPQGWVLVVPDNDRPVFHIYAEGQDYEASESLTGFYINKIKELNG